jgi:hypothetical protein
MYRITFRITCRIGLHPGDIAPLQGLKKNATKLQRSEIYKGGVKPHTLGDTYDLSAKNPNKKEEAALRQPKEILEEMNPKNAVGLTSK